MTDSHSSAFIRALQRSDLTALQQLPKSDLHNHSLLGSLRSRLEEHIGKKLPAPGPMESIASMDEYIFGVLAPYLIDLRGFIYGITAAMQQAVEDGIALLEMSVDLEFVRIIPGGAQGLADLMKEIHAKTAPGVRFIPQLGLNRRTDLHRTLELLEEALEPQYFRSVDLYGDELCRPAKELVPVYRKAADAGLKLRAHAGEFGDAESVRETVELLELSEVQHGIAAASSPEVMHWLRDHQIQLNICPTSNVMLCRVADLKHHPIRTLYDAGIPVTVNTDDLMIFDQSVSREYSNLYHAGLFSAEELDTIRLQGLRSLKII